MLYAFNTCLQKIFYKLKKNIKNNLQNYNTYSQYNIENIDNNNKELIINHPWITL